GVADEPPEPTARTDGSHAGSDVGVAGTGSVADETPDDESSEIGISQPPDDEEMPLADHVEEMINRLAIVLFAASVVTVVAFPIAERLITTIWFGVLPAQEVASPHVYGPLELKLTELKLASLAGLTIALPVAVYETYLFMRPGLYPNERRYYLAAVPTSLVLAVVGISFAYFLVLPGLFTYFLYYSDVTANVAFGLRETFNLILTMMGMLAVVFQIPLFIMLATMMGITSRQWLADNRLLFWGAFLGLAFLFSPDPTGMAPLIVAVTMVTLYEGTLLLLRWVGR
ncbi:twin-arginine translocase subunit TatC, partial [Natronoarchaeum mannanilyticum]